MLQSLILELKMKLLEGKTALIIGGSQGIGLASAKLLSDSGANVIIVGRDSQKLSIAQNYFIEQVATKVCDISSVYSIKSLYQELKESAIKLDILFVNAAIVNQISLENVTEDQFDETFNTNFKGVFFSVKESLSLLNKNTSIILTASIAGLIAFPKHSLYSSAKAGIIHLAKLFGADLVRKNIRVNSISPGYIDTPAWDKWKNSPVYQEIKKNIPYEGRFGTEGEVAELVLFLASEKSSYITGQNFVIDGGFTTFFDRDGN